MSLKQNGRLLNQMPLRFRGGAILSFEYQETNKSQLRNIYAGESDIDPINGIASGHLPPSTWLIAQKSGGISSFVNILGTANFSASGAMGVNIESAPSGTSTFSATGGLIVSGSSSISGSTQVSGGVTAALEAACSIAGACTLSGSLSAIGESSSLVSGAGAISASPGALGTLLASITPFTPLTAQGLSDAVWQYPKNNNTVSGSMKEVLEKTKSNTDLIPATL